MRVVVGIDGSDASSEALRWAARLATDSGAELRVVHAHRRPYAEIQPAEYDRLLAERAALVAGAWAHPATEGGAVVETEVTEGDPRRALLDAAEQARADLLVLGRSGVGGRPGFLHLGSVVEHVAHHTTVPLAVVPSGATGPVRRIVVGVDGSVGADAAVRWCARLAPALAVEVAAVAVQEPLAEWTPSWDPRNWRRDTERDIDEWVRPLTEAGVTVEKIVDEHLTPADELVRIAADRGADLLVVGTRGIGGFLELRSGGVAIKVLHRATTPIVLVPPDGV